MLIRLKVRNLAHYLIPGERLESVYGRSVNKTSYAAFFASFNNIFCSADVYVPDDVLLVRIDVDYARKVINNIYALKRFNKRVKVGNVAVYLFTGNTVELLAVFSYKNTNFFTGISKLF